MNVQLHRNSSIDPQFSSFTSSPSASLFRGNVEARFKKINNDGDVFLGSSDIFSILSAHQPSHYGFRDDAEKSLDDDSYLSPATARKRTIELTTPEHQSKTILSSPLNWAVMPPPLSGNVEAITDINNNTTQRRQRRTYYPSLDGKRLKTCPDLA